jgi:glycosyltransferase involved in cell wall biosynthesis
MFIEKAIDRMGDAAVASSPENAQKISTLSGRPVEVLLDGVNLEYYTADKKKNELRHELELPEKSVIVTYLGALITNKGIGYLFDAFHRTLERYPNVFILLGGSPPEEGERFLRETQFPGRIRFIYPLDYFEVPKLLSACDIGVDPKDSDTNQASGKILQYMGTGLAIACFGRESNRGYLDGNAVYAEEVTGEKLAEAIGKLVSGDSLRVRCGEGNLGRAKEFNWDRAGKQLEKLYEKII